jgi:hypothetical protein
MRMPAGRASMAMQSRSQARAVRRRATATLMNVMLLCILTALAIFAFPTFLLVCFGMLPSLVAYVVDKTPRWALTLSVGPPNLAVTAVFIAKLWASDNNTAAGVFAMMGNPYIWCVIYLAAAAGWGIYFGMPIIVTAFKEYSLDRERAGLIDKVKALREEWGEEVGPDDVIPQEVAPPPVPAKPAPKAASQSQIQARPQASAPAATVPAPKPASSPAANVAPAQPV